MCCKITDKIVVYLFYISYNIFKLMFFFLGIPMEITAVRGESTDGGGGGRACQVETGV